MKSCREKKKKWVRPKIKEKKMKWQIVYLACQKEVYYTCPPGSIDLT